jgi:hypothetical protein
VGNEKASVKSWKLTKSVEDQEKYLRCAERCSPFFTFNFFKQSIPTIAQSGHVKGSLLLLRPRMYFQPLTGRIYDKEKKWRG